MLHSPNFTRLVEWNFRHNSVRSVLVTLTSSVAPALPFPPPAEAANAAAAPFLSLAATLPPLTCFVVLILFLFLAAMAASGGLRLFLAAFLAGFGLSLSDAEQELSSESSE